MGVVCMCCLLPAGLRSTVVHMTVTGTWLHGIDATGYPGWRAPLSWATLLIEPAQDHPNHASVPRLAVQHIGYSVS